MSESQKERAENLKKNRKEVDYRIMALLQEDALMPVGEVAKLAGISRTACWHRIKKLEEKGYIRGRVALLNSKMLGIKILVYVSIRTTMHSKEWTMKFSEHVSSLPEVTGFYRMAGSIDYLIRVQLPSVEAYDDFYQRLVSGIEISDVSAGFVMEQIKETTALPLDYAQLPQGDNIE